MKTEVFTKRGLRNLKPCSWLVQVWKKSLCLKLVCSKLDSIVVSVSFDSQLSVTFVFKCQCQPIFNEFYRLLCSSILPTRCIRFWVSSEFDSPVNRSIVTWFDSRVLLNSIVNFFGIRFLCDSTVWAVIRLTSLV